MKGLEYKVLLKILKKMEEGDKKPADVFIDGTPTFPGSLTEKSTGVVKHEVAKITITLFYRTKVSDLLLKSTTHFR